MIARWHGSKVSHKPLDAREIVYRQEVVDVPERCLHATRQRFVARGSQQRIQPDHTRTAAANACKLTSEYCWVATIPSVRYNQHHRTVAHHPARPTGVEGPQRIADARPASPIVDVLDESRDRAMAARR